MFLFVFSPQRLKESMAFLHSFTEIDRSDECKIVLFPSHSAYSQFDKISETTLQRIKHYDRMEESDETAMETLKQIFEKISTFGNSIIFCNVFPLLFIFRSPPFFFFI